MHWTRNSVRIPIWSYLHVSTCSYLHGCIALVVKLVYLHFRLIRFSIEGGESHKSLVKLSASHLVVIFSIFSSFALNLLPTLQIILCFHFQSRLFTLTLCYFLSCLVLLVFILNLFIYRPLSTLQIIPCYFNFYFGSRQHLLSLSLSLCFFLSFFHVLFSIFPHPCTAPPCLYLSLMPPTLITLSINYLPLLLFEELFIR